MNKFIIESVELEGMEAHRGKDGSVYFVDVIPEPYTPKMLKAVSLSLRSFGAIDIEHIFKACDAGKKVTLIIEDKD